MKHSELQVSLLHVSWAASTAAHMYNLRFGAHVTKLRRGVTSIKSIKQIHNWRLSSVKFQWNLLDSMPSKCQLAFSQTKTNFTICFNKRGGNPSYKNKAHYIHSEDFFIVIWLKYAINPQGLTHSALYIKISPILIWFFL